MNIEEQFFLVAKHSTWQISWYLIVYHGRHQNMVVLWKMVCSSYRQEMIILLLNIASSVVQQ
jgi:hypothetical protein